MIRACRRVSADASATCPTAAGPCACWGTEASWSNGTSPSSSTPPDAMASSSSRQTLTPFASASNAPSTPTTSGRAHAKGGLARVLPCWWCLCLLEGFLPRDSTSPMRFNYPTSAVTSRDISRPASSVAPFAGRALDMTREVSGPTRTLLPQQMEPGAQRGGTGAVSTSFLVSYADSSSASHIRSDCFVLHPLDCNLLARELFTHELSTKVWSISVR